LAVFRERRGFRLLTEAEWEFVWRSGARTAYAFGSDRTVLDRYAWFSVNSQRRVHPAGHLRPNSRGLFDMHGNVWEWCFDRFPTEYDNVKYATGAQWKDARLIRGGGFDWYTSDCRSANRGRHPPTDARVHIGFRLAVLCGDQ
jgi:formylglycine-generating enzyme required for sulfatase activity